MKRLLSLLLSVVLLMGMTTACATQIVGPILLPGDTINRVPEEGTDGVLPVANFTLHGYELGKKVSDASLTVDVEWLEIVEPIMIMEVDDEGYGAAAEGEFRANTQYALLFTIQPEGYQPGDFPSAEIRSAMAVPADTEMPEEERQYLLSQMELTNGYKEKDLEAINYPVLMVGFMLNPLAEMPATGDGANLMLWISMLAFAAIGMIVMARKAKYTA